MHKQIDEAFLRSWGFGKHNEDSKCVGFMIQPVRTVQLPSELHVDIFDDGHVEVLVAQSVGAYKHYVRLFDNLVSISQAEMLFKSFCLQKEKVQRGKCTEANCKGVMNIASDGVGPRYLE